MSQWNIFKKNKRLYSMLILQRYWVYSQLFFTLTILHSCEISIWIGCDPLHLSSSVFTPLHRVSPPCTPFCRVDLHRASSPCTPFCRIDLHRASSPCTPFCRVDLHRASSPCTPFCRIDLHRASSPCTPFCRVDLHRASPPWPPFCRVAQRCLSRHRAGRSSLLSRVRKSTPHGHFPFPTIICSRSFLQNMNARVNQRAFKYSKTLSQVAGTMVADSSSVRVIAWSNLSQVALLHMHVGKWVAVCWAPRGQHM